MIDRVQQQHMTADQLSEASFESADWISQMVAIAA